MPDENQHQTTPPPIPDPEKLKPAGLSNTHKRYLYYGVTLALVMLILANIVGSRQGTPAKPTMQSLPSQEQNPTAAQIQDWENNLKQVRVLQHRNFAFGSLLMGAVGALLYGMTTIVPIFLETLMGYPAFQSGIAMIPRGVGSFLAMPLLGKLTEKMDGRVLVAIGFVLFGWSTYSLSHVTLDISPWSLAWPLFVDGVSIGFLFVPLNVLSLGGLSSREINNATGIYNLLRNVGGSAGIAAVSTFLARRAEVHQFMMVGHLQPSNYLYRARLDGLANLLQTRTPNDPSQALRIASRLSIRRAD